MTNHSNLRICGRLASLISTRDIEVAEHAAQKYHKESKVYVKVRKLDREVTINELGYQGGNGTGINGDCIVAVICAGAIVTFMLAKSQNTWYFKRDSRMGLVNA